MANLTVFDPFREMATLRSMVDQVFDNMLTRQIEGWRGYEWMALDMYQTNDEVVVKAVLPGVKPEDIHVTVVNGMLTIRGEVKEEKVSEDATYHIRERRSGVISRSVQLPVAVNVENAKAEYENGILTLILPKTEEVRPKTISVKVK
ncbi:MAG: Hsp20/alpha crystallin family protein [Chloroflexota bacterium]|nr:MAG: heat-shock protein Hsp20 [Bellilinea sp.]